MPKSLPNRKRLTDLAVARVGPGITWDTLLPCFGVRVGARTRTWIVAIKGAKHKVGQFPELGVAEARTKARELMAGGVEMAPERQFHTIVDDFLQHGRTRKGRPLRQNSINQYRRNLSRYAKPLHDRPFAEIKRAEVAGLIRDVANESGATTASLMRSMLHRLFEYGIEVGEREDNPAAHTPSYEVTKGSRVLSDGEIAALWAATDLGAENNTPGDYGLILRMMLWTGCRRSEAGGMRWSELQGGTNTTLIWHVPGSRTKNHRELILPLPRQASALISGHPRIVGRDTLFGTWSDRGFTTWSESKAALDAQLKFSRPWVLHDIRRTVETRLAGLAIGREVRSRILNHDIGPIAESYDHYDYQLEIGSALQRWADKLAEIVTNSQPEVIKLKSRQRS